MPPRLVVAHSSLQRVLAPSAPPRRPLDGLELARPLMPWAGAVRLARATCAAVVAFTAWAVPAAAQTAQAAQGPQPAPLALPAPAGDVAPPLPASVLRALARAGVPASAVSMVVAPLPPPPGAVGPAAAQAALLTPRLSWQADLPMNPASVMKLVTTYAGLDLLGPGHLWRTRVYAQGPVQAGVLNGNLLIQGGGDPKLVVERLADLVRAIQDKGVHAVRGDIVLDRRIFHLPRHDAAAFDDDPLKPYNAGPDGLLINFKALVVKLIPDAATRRVRVELEPPLAGIAYPAELPAAAGACGDWRARLGADLTRPEQITFAGRYALSCGEQQITVAYADPDSYAARAIEGVWRASGGLLTGRVRWNDGPVVGHPLATGFSLPLADVIADINKFSNNVMAQQLFLTLSAADGRASFAESRSVLARWWRSRFGVRAQPVVENGSGLSRQARVTAASLVALLQHAAANPQAGAFEHSLSIAGVDGTTRRMAARNPGSQAINSARLKTGTLRDVAAVAGYAYGRSGRNWAVVGLINHPNAPAARPALDHLVEWAVQDGL